MAMVANFKHKPRWGQLPSAQLAILRATRMAKVANAEDTFEDNRYPFSGNEYTDERKAMLSPRSVR